MKDWFIFLIKYVAGVVGGIIGLCYGEINKAMIILLALVVIDYITGIIKSIYNKKLSSEIGFKGIAKKVFIFIVIAVAHLIDMAVPDLNDMLKSAATLFYIVNESISILENAAECSVKIPTQIIKVLDQLNKEDNND